jgi:hypothetical protein
MDKDLFLGAVQIWMEDADFFLQICQRLPSSSQILFKFSCRIFGKIKLNILLNLTGRRF